MLVRPLLTFPGKLGNGLVQDEEAVHRLPADNAVSVIPVGRDKRYGENDVLAALHNLGVGLAGTTPAVVLHKPALVYNYHCVQKTFAFGPRDSSPGCLPTRVGYIPVAICSFPRRKHGVSGRAESARGAFRDGFCRVPLCVTIRWMNRRLY